MKNKKGIMGLIVLLQIGAIVLSVSAQNYYTKEIQNKQPLCFEMNKSVAEKVETLLDEGKYLKAIRTLNQFLCKNRYSSHAYYQRACAYDLLGEREKARLDLEKAIQYNPYNTKYKNEYRILFGELPEKVLFNSNSSRSHVRKMLFFTKVQVLYESGNHASAISLISRYIGENQESAMAYYHRAKALQKAGLYRKARLDIKQAVFLSPTNKKINVYYKVLWGDDYIKRSFKTIKTASSNSQSNAFFAHMKYYYEKKEHWKAIYKLNAYIVKHPQSAQAYYHRAYALREAELFAQVIHDLSKAIQLDPNNEIYRNEYQFAIIDETNFVEGNIIAKRNPSKAFFIHMKDMYEHGEYNKALYLLTNVVKENPQLAEGYYHRARASEEAGFMEQAEADIRRAVQYAPANSDYQYYYEDIFGEKP